MKTQMGYMNVAGAELTALDIVAEEEKIGGLSRAAEILLELCETMQWDEPKLPLLAYFSSATIQRLGYLCEGGRTVVENCQMLCCDCNRRKGVK